MFKILNIAVDTERAYQSKSTQAEQFAINTNDYGSVRFEVSLTQDGQPVDLTWATVKLAIRKPDRTIVFQNGEVAEALGGRCRFDLETQSHDKSGGYVAEVMIYHEDGKVVVSRAFPYHVNAGLLEDSSVESTSWYQDINTLQQTVADLEIGLNEQINQAMTDATADANLAAETANQRVVELDGFEASITSQLADIETQKANQADLNNTNIILSEKASKAEVMSLVGEISDGTPLFATNVAGMIDTTRNYVNMSDGLLYTHNGTSWVSTGVPYQSTGLAPQAVTPDKTTFFGSILNYFDASTATNGYDISSSTGNLVPSANFFASDWIPVTAGQSYKVKNFATANDYTNFAFYTADKVFIQRISQSAAVTAPPTAAFLRISRDADKNSLTLSLSTNVPTKYEPYLTAYLHDASIPKIGSDKLEPQSVTPDKTTFFGDSYNLFDKSATSDGYDISGSSGILVPATGYFASDWIPVTPNGLYKLRNFAGASEFTSFAFYTAAKVFINRVQTSGIVTVPANGYFVRIASTADKNVITFSLNSNLPNKYKPFGSRKLKVDLIPNLNTTRFGALKWNCLGDSITAANKYQTFANLRLGFSLLRNYGIGGTCIAVKADDSNLDTAFVRRYTVMDNDADVITVMGGTNDFAANIPLGDENVKDEKTVLGAMAIIIEGLIAKYPGKYIVWATLPQRNNGFETTGLNNNGESTADFAEGIKRTCRKYAIPCVDVHNESGINKYNMDTNGSLMPDKVHPSDAGYKRLAALFVHTIEKVVF